MRSSIKLATALAAFAGLLLAGCAPVSPTEAVGNVANLECADVSAQLTIAQSDLDTAKANQNKLEGTPGEASASQEVDRLNTLIDALEDRTATCEDEDATEAGSADDGLVGIENEDGTVTQLPWYEGSNETVVMDTTQDPNTPPLLDASLKFTASTLSWAGLVERVGDQQWYIDGVNARAAQTGFDWDDVLEFAKVNREVDGKVEGVSALAIQVFNLSGLTDEQVRDEVRKYITPAVEKVIGITVDDLPIQHIDGGFVNTRNVGSASSPKMGNYFDTQHMIRVSLMPIKFDENGKPIGIDGSRGAGIFIDCANLHWVPPRVWVCEDSSCTPPPPPPVCPWNPQLPPDSPDCLNPKGDGGPENGWTPLKPGPLTDGKGSQHQQDSGDVSGNVTDNKVPSGTKSGDVTTDLPSGTVTSPGASSGGDSQSGGKVDSDNTKQDTGGTDGATCVPDPIAGITC